jgi:hypothetical protein
MDSLAYPWPVKSETASKSFDSWTNLPTILRVGASAQNLRLANDYRSNEIEEEETRHDFNRSASNLGPLRAAAFLVH